MWQFPIQRKKIILQLHLTEIPMEAVNPVMVECVSRYTNFEHRLNRQA